MGIKFAVLSGAYFCLLLFYSSATFADSSYGIFMVVKGDVKVERTDKQVAVAKVGLKVFPGDTVKTAVDSRAKITMSDRNNIHVSPQSTVKIAAYSQEEKNKNVELQLNQGKIRNEVNNRYDGNKSKFIIKTPSAVAGVRGTDFLVNFDTKTNKTEVITFKGSVAFSGFSEQGVGETVIVNKQQSSSVGDGPPAPPQGIPDADFKKIETETRANPFADAGANNQQGTGGNAPPPRENREPLKDSGDQSPEVFDKMPAAGEQNRPPQPPPMKQLLPPPPDTRINDAIRNKTDKTKVIIQPKSPTGTAN